VEYETALNTLPSIRRKINNTVCARAKWQGLIHYEKFHWVRIQLRRQFVTDVNTHLLLKVP
jgi:hypothetical protein